MDKADLRAWWAHRQGLDGSLSGASPADVLAQTGWSRSVGGANPYLALFCRAGTSREAVDQAVGEKQIHELPSARGCTYVLPACDFAIGLLVGQSFGDDTNLSTAVKHFGVTSEDVDALGEKVCRALETGPQDPRQLKAALGDAVVNFGEEGKKRGVTTSLPLALGRLQSRGQIRRISLNGRVDNQRYAYALWRPSPLDGLAMSRDEAFRELAKRYFRWTGPATVKNFAWLSGLGVKASQAAVDGLGLVPVEPGSDALLFSDDLDAMNEFRAPKEPCFVLTGSIDNLSHLRLGLPDLVDADDAGRTVPGEKGLLNLTGLSELTSNAIYDRGRLVGAWEFDPEDGTIAWTAWVDGGSALREAVAKTEAYVRDQLGDARTFSLDGPESRKPRLAQLRAMPRP